jgi:hypothetical protein
MSTPREHDLYWCFTASRQHSLRICGCSWVRPHYIYRQLCLISTVLLFDYSQSQSDAEVRTARPDTTKPHTSLRQVKHPVLVLTPVHASVRPPYFTRQQMWLLEKASGTYTHCGRVCSLRQNPPTECTLLQGVSL